MAEEDPLETIVVAGIGEISWLGLSQNTDGNYIAIVGIIDRLFFGVASCCCKFCVSVAFFFLPGPGIPAAPLPLPAPGCAGRYTPHLAASISDEPVASHGAPFDHQGHQVVSWLLMRSAGQWRLTSEWAPLNQSERAVRLQRRELPYCFGPFSTGFPRDSHLL